MAGGSPATRALATNSFPVREFAGRARQGTVSSNFPPSGSCCISEALSPETWQAKLGNIRWKESGGSRSRRRPSSCAGPAVVGVPGRRCSRPSTDVCALVSPAVCVCTLVWARLGGCGCGCLRACTDKCLLCMPPPGEPLVRVCAVRVSVWQDMACVFQLRVSLFRGM